MDPFFNFRLVYLIARHGEHGADVADMLLRAAFPVEFQFADDDVFGWGQNNSDNSGSGMEENPSDFGIYPFIRPIRVLLAQPCGFHFARRPVELLRQPQPALRSHAAVRGYLLRAGLFVR